MPEGEVTIPTAAEVEAMLAQLQAYYQQAPTAELAATIASMQAIVSAAQQRTADEAAAERAAFLAPLTNVTGSAEFATVKAAILGIDNRYDQEPFGQQLRCLKIGFQSLVPA